jgi:hypothetical protein
VSIYIQKNAGNIGNGGSGSVSFSSNNTAGNTLVLYANEINFGSGPGSGSDVTLISDTLGNSYGAPIFAGNPNGGGQYGSFCWLVFGCKGGANTITIHWSTGNYFDLAVMEYPSSAGLRASGTAAVTSTAADAVSVTGAISGDVSVCMGNSNSGTFGSPGFFGSNTAALVMTDSSSGAGSDTWSIEEGLADGSSPMICSWVGNTSSSARIAVALKPAGGGGFSLDDSTSPYRSVFDEGFPPRFYFEDFPQVTQPSLTVADDAGIWLPTSETIAAYRAPVTEEFVSATASALDDAVPPYAQIAAVVEPARIPWTEDFSGELTPLDDGTRTAPPRLDAYPPPVVVVPEDFAVPSAAVLPADDTASPIAYDLPVPSPQPFFSEDIARIVTPLDDTGPPAAPVPDQPAYGFPIANEDFAIQIVEDTGSPGPAVGAPEAPAVRPAGEDFGGSLPVEDGLASQAQYVDATIPPRPLSDDLPTTFATEESGTRPPAPVALSEAPWPILGDELPGPPFSPIGLDETSVPISAYVELATSLGVRLGEDFARQALRPWIQVRCIVAALAQPRCQTVALEQPRCVVAAL